MHPVPHTFPSSLTSLQSGSPSQNQYLELHWPLSHCHRQSKYSPDLGEVGSMGGWLVAVGVGLVGGVPETVSITLIQKFSIEI